MTNWRGTLAVLGVALCALAVILQTSGLRAEGERRFADMRSYGFPYNGAARTFELYIPPTYAAGHPAPLIVALHGRFSSGKALNAMSHFQRLADQHGAILLYPEAAGAFWGDAGHTALQRAEPDVDDVGFITSLIAAVRTNYAIDREQVYLVGHDGGGAMAMRVLCQAPEDIRFAAATIVSALMELTRR